MNLGGNLNEQHSEKLGWKTSISINLFQQSTKPSLGVLACFFKNRNLYVVNLALILALLGGMFGTVSAVQASTFTVTNINDSGAGSLRQAITIAVSGDTIIFNPALAGQTITLSSTLVVNKNMTINGNAPASKVRVSGNNTIRVFEVISGITLTLDSLDVRNGFSSVEQGSGVLNFGTVNIKNSIFSGNVARHGGAIKNTGTLNIVNSTFSGNSASGPANTSAYGGGIYNFGTLNIEDSTFAGNIASPYGGGGGVHNRSGTVSIINSTFSGNNARDGGAINNNAEGTATIMNSIFSGNSAENGGGIINYENLDITNSTFLSNSAIGGGGGILNHGMLSLTNSTISSNSSGGEFTSSDGGGIYNDGTMTTANTTFSDNSSNSDGGGIYNTNSLTIVNSTFSGNTDSSGRGILSGGTLNITNSTFSESGILNVGTLNSRSNIFANSTFGSDCYNNGTIGININNLVETNSAPPNNCGTPTLTIDPKLGPLADNGGPNQTLALLTGSPALDTGDNATCTATDQRGVSRPQGDACDIGAYEYGPSIAEVDVTIDVSNVGNYNILPEQSVSDDYGINGGPVHVSSTNGLPIFTSQRAIFGTSFNSIVGYPADQLTTDYWFTSYDDVGMITYLVIGNPHATLTAQVDVYIGGIKKNATPYSIAPGQRIFPRYGINAGPVHVVSTNGVNIFTSERTKFGNSFNEVMGYPGNQLTTDYWFTSYDDVGMITYLVIGNPHATLTAQVDVYIGGNKMNATPLLHRSRTAHLPPLRHQCRTRACGQHQWCGYLHQRTLQVRQHVQ